MQIHILQALWQAIHLPTALLAPIFPNPYHASRGEGARGGCKAVVHLQADQRKYGPDNPKLCAKATICLDKLLAAKIKARGLTKSSSSSWVFLHHGDDPLLSDSGGC